jgi:hypothetical protein
MELSPFRVMSWPWPFCERIQSLPDCFKQPRTVVSEPLAPEVLVALWLLLLGVAGCWLFVWLFCVALGDWVLGVLCPLLLPELLLLDCANAIPVASISVNKSFFVMCCSFEDSICPSGY